MHLVQLGLKASPGLKTTHSRRRRKSFPAEKPNSLVLFPMKMQVLDPLNLWNRFSPHSFPALALP